MSRTPLLHRLQQLYRDFVEHEATGHSFDAIAAESLQRQSSRRGFLKIAGAGAVGTLARPSRIFAAGFMEEAPRKVSEPPPK